ncbi:hypothetical protein JHK85_000668 [Glycine max]|nr:hypothetical protein JHK85_000668 [Glycine max]
MDLHTLINRGHMLRVRLHHIEALTGLLGLYQVLLKVFDEYRIVLKAELVAMLEGLKLAWEMEFDDVICLSDSFNGINLVKDGEGSCYRYATITESIRNFLKED